MGGVFLFPNYSYSFNEKNSWGFEGASQLIQCIQEVLDYTQYTLVCNSSIREDQKFKGCLKYT